MPHPATKAELEALLRFATPKQQEYIQAVIEHGSMRAAGSALDVDHTNMVAAVARARANAARQGYSPDHDMTHTVPEPFTVRGVSTLYDAEGNVSQQWVKTRLDDQQKHAQIQAFAEQLADEVRGKAKPVKAPKADKKDRFCVYPMGDPHLGMYAYGPEAGEDVDLNSASRDLKSAMVRLVDSCPASEEAVILNLGDFFHADNSTNETSRSGARLDVDTRWNKVIGVGAETMKVCIETALEKHGHVTVRNNIGNHDDHSSQALSLILAAYYSKEPRVTIDTSPNPFFYYRFGKVLLASTHGHNVKVLDLLSIMAHDRPIDWGETQHRYWYLGHFHTQKVHEIGSLLVEYFRTLAGKDAWTNEKGYRSGRDMNAIVHHAEFGQIERHRADILMVRS